MSIKIGFLPLYLELYDRALPEFHEQMEAFSQTVATALEHRGLAVSRAPLCRIEEEFTRVIHDFESQGVSVIVTLHLAYSPSLESAAVLAATRLPLVVLDTTPDWEFGPEQKADAIMFNHGIHGVQDMCNLLIRNGKPFSIQAGHLTKSDVLDRVFSDIRAAAMAHAMRTARVGRIGPGFAGMGDFAVAESILAEEIGMRVQQSDPQKLAAWLPPADAPEVAAEMQIDRERFDMAELDDETHRQSVRAGLAVRRWIDAESLTAMSMNFLAFNGGADDLPVVPFIEASKAMARGIGYAGEGDVLTAAFVGALASVYPQTTFTEMFCPDWRGERVFLSHMGEVNADLLAGNGMMLKKPFPWSDAGDPAVITGCLKGGSAVFADVAPGPDDSFTLIAVGVDMVAPEDEDGMAGTVHGWFKPHLGIERFLETYSLAGGTHHAALVYDASLQELEEMGRHLGWNTLLID